MNRQNMENQKMMQGAETLIHTVIMHIYFYTNQTETLTVLPLISEVLPLTARGISDSQVTDGAVTETDDRGRGRWRQRDGVEKDGCVMLYHRYLLTSVIMHNFLN